MDRKYIEENDIAGRYLRGQLTPEETIEFEVYLIDNPELIKELEMDTVFLKTMPYIDQLPGKRVYKRGWFSTIVWQASLATIAVCLVAIQIYLFTVNGKSEYQIGIPEHAYLDTVRSVPMDEPVSVELFDYHNELELIHPVTDHSVSKYRIAINESSGNKEALDGKDELIIDTYLQKSGEIKVSLPINLVPAGRYLIKINPLDSNGIPKEPANNFTLDISYN